MKKQSFLNPLFVLFLALFLSKAQISFATSIETDGLTVNGSETVNGSATMNGAVTMNQGATVIGNATVNGNLTVTGTSSITADWANPGTLGSTTPNTIKGTTIESTMGLTVDAGGIVSKGTVAAGGGSIIGQADSGVAIANGDKLGNFLLGGAKDNAHSMDNAAGISSYATQNWSGSAAGANLKLEVTPNGSTTRQVAVTVDQDKTTTFAGPVKAWGVETPIWGGTSAGSADAQTLTPSPAITALANGQTLWFIAGYSNSSATPTMDVSGLGPKTVTRQGGLALQSGDIAANASHGFMYDATNNRYLLLNPATVASSQIGSGAITGSQIANGTITSTQISSTAGLSDGQIADGAVTTSKIANGAVTSTQISGTAGITGAQISSTAGLSGGQIADGAITAAKLASGVGGKVLQAVWMHYSSSGTYMNSTSTYSDITGMSQAITLASSSSKVIVYMTGGGYSSTLTRPGFRITRDGTTVHTVDNIVGHSGAPKVWTGTIIAIDSPGSSGSKTYKLQANSPEGDGYFLRDADGNLAGGSILLIELAS